MKKGVKILGLLAGLGALAVWRYKKATPEKKQKVNDFINNAKDNISKFSDELKNKAEELLKKDGEEAIPKGSISQFINDKEKEISEIILEDGTNVNKEMVKSGLAWHYKKYSSNLEYARLEELAMKNKVGLWSDPNAVSPWSYRK